MEDNIKNQTCEKPTIDEGTSEGLPIQKPKNTQFGPFPDNIVQKMIVTVINKQKDKKLGIRVARSLNVSSVQPGSAAEGILKAGDLILSLNGVKSISRTQIEEQIPLITNGLFPIFRLVILPIRCRIFF
uniref:PDZ domain-containing protein n=1 Tax=Panagrolaimus davidi TaxID=227884 RepID=A0A914QS21_9BILA